MQKTPLYAECEAVGGKIVDFHGWALPVQFAGIIDEHHHTRQAASVFDCSHMAEFVIEGAAGLEAVGKLLICDARSIREGRGRYSAVLNDEGGLLDDVILMKLAEEKWYLVSNAGTRGVVGPLFTGAGAKDVTDATAKIDVQGPASRDVMSAAGLSAAVQLKYFGVCETDWRGMPIVLTRMGYTGELGYEIYCPNDAAAPLWQALLTCEGVKPAGLGARDTLRLEVGYPLSGEDFDAGRTPLEAGMESFVAWDTEFPGKTRLEAQRDAGDYPRLTPLKAAGRRAPRHGFALYQGDEEAGVVTSGTFGASLGCGVGLGYVAAPFAKAGMVLEAGERRIAVETADAPLYTQGTCRS